LLDGVDILGLSDEAMRQLRLAKIAMVSQGANELAQSGDPRQEADPGWVSSHGVNVAKAKPDQRIADLFRAGSA